MHEIIRARKLFSAYYNVVPTLPIDMIKLCKCLKFAVRSIELEGIEGCHLRPKSDRHIVILLNDKQHRHRKRFTLAHEIGHILLGHDPAIFDGESIIEARQAWQETEANRFASELLLPVPELKKHGMLTVYEMSEMFDVSYDVAEIKAQQLGWVGEKLDKFYTEKMLAQLEAMGL